MTQYNMPPSTPEPYDAVEARAQPRMQRRMERYGASYASTGPMDADQQLRRRAIARIRGRQYFVVQIVVYLLINVVLVAAWWRSGHGFPWPLFVTVFWGIGLFWQGSRLFGREASEDRIQEEMHRLRQGPLSPLTSAATNQLGATHGRLNTEWLPIRRHRHRSSP